MAAAGALSAGGRWWPRATPHPRSGQRPRMPGCDGAGTAKRSHPASEVRGGGREEPPHNRGQGWHPRPRAAAGRSNPTPEARAATESSNPTPKARDGGLEGQPHVEGQEGRREEIPLIQGKEQQLCFAGAAVKRYPTPKVREIQIRW